MAQLREYEVGGYTFQLDSEDVKRLRDQGAQIKPVERKAASPQNKSVTPKNK